MEIDYRDSSQENIEKNRYEDADSWKRSCDW